MKKGGLWLLDSQSSSASTWYCTSWLNLCSLKTLVPCRRILVRVERDSSPGACLISNVVVLEINSQLGALPIKVKPDPLSFSKLTGYHFCTHIPILCTSFTYNFLCIHSIFESSLRTGYIPELSLYPYNSWNKEGT